MFDTDASKKKFAEIIGVGYLFKKVYLRLHIYLILHIFLRCKINKFNDKLKKYYDMDQFY